MKSLVTWMAAATVVAVGASEAAAQGPASIRVTTAPTLIDCKGEQCFRLVVNAFDAAGNAVALPANAAMSVTEGERQYTVFHTLAVPTADRAGAATAAAGQARFVLLVVDTSGSMREVVEGGTATKFETARAAILETLLAGLRDGTDHIAVMGFDSVRVRARVDEAPFRSSKAQAEADLRSLAASRSGNTALYSAVDYALDRIDVIPDLPAARGKQLDVLLVIFTDGENDVRPDRGDDPGLLTGTEGLDRVLSKARRKASQLPLTIITVGLEGRRTFNQEALRRLAFPPDAKTYYRAQSRADLVGAFGSITTEKANRVFLSFGPVRRSRLELAGSPIAFRVSLGDLSAMSPSFEPPAMGPPSAGAPLTASERDAFERAFPPASSSWISPGLNTMLTRLAILGLYALLLATLWFGIPRLIWPERYAAGAARLASQPSPRRPAPPSGRAPGHGAGDVTIVARQDSRQVPRGARGPNQGEVPRESPVASPRNGPAPRPPTRPAPQPPRPQAGAAPDATVFIPARKPPTD